MTTVQLQICIGNHNSCMPENISKARCVNVYNNILGLEIHSRGSLGVLQMLPLSSLPSLQGFSEYLVENVYLASSLFPPSPL